MLGRPERVCGRVFWVRHSNEQRQDELNTMVDDGGEVGTVIEGHELYGRISVELPIRSRRHVQEFVENVSKGQARPLKELVHDGVHGHLVRAERESDLDAIEQVLRITGYLVAETEQ